MRHAAGMAWGDAARKARHREMETAPEEMHRARLSKEAGAELLEHPIGIEENLEEASHRIRVIGCMLVVFRKPDRLGQFVRHLVDGDIDTKFCARCQDI